MSKSFVRPLGAWVAAVGLCTSQPAFACSFGSVPNWLTNGGIAIAQTPEFFWADEIRKIAAPFKPATDRPTHPLAVIPSGEVELAAYEKGAAAFHLGKEHYTEARAAWEALLKLPPEQRRGRSVWAAFMLGKVDLYERKPEAVKWFQMTRELASQGFADELHLAEDSYGWEAKSELEQGHYEKSAPLYLTQLALGQDSAIVSLKYLVGSSAAAARQLPVNPAPAKDAATQQNKSPATGEPPFFPGPDMDRAALDPLLRKITSAHILAIEGGRTSGDRLQSPSTSHEASDCEIWLKAIERAKLTQVDNADQLGWIAYAAGNYADAEHWLKLAPTDSATSLWLKAKLLRRKGDLKTAAKLMAQVVKRMRAEPPPPELQNSSAGISFDVTFDDLPDQLYSASGDLGALHLSRGDFISAFDAFYTGGLWADAAYVADHILTADELKTYVDAQVHWTGEDDAKSGKGDKGEAEPTGSSLRALLGRHLVREHRYREARPYLPPQTRPLLDDYAAALSKAAEASLSKANRAEAFFKAANIVYSEGMQLMSAEDEFYRLDAYYGTGRLYNTAIERETGMRYETAEKGSKVILVFKPQRLYTTVTKEEKKRLAQHKLDSKQRYHYLYTAASLAWKAALLLPDDTAELANVLNTAGLWIQDDEAAADKFFQAIERRAHNTELGRAAGLKHWFIHDFNPKSPAPDQ